MLDALPAVHPTSSSLNHLQLARLIVQQAWPNWIAKLLAIGMMVADTLIAGYHSTADLAAVAIGSSYYVSVVVMLTGAIQALSPTLAHLVGAGQQRQVGPTLQQGFWLGLGLAGVGAALMLSPQLFFTWAQVPRTVAQGAASYLQAAAWGLPALMLYRTFYEFCNALRQPKPLMVISAVVTCTHIPLAWALTNGAWGLPELGGTGCGVSTAVVNTLAMLLSAVYLLGHPVFKQHRVFQGWQAPRWATQSRLLRLGVPMGLSSFVDISSFTLIAILVARLGAETVAGHRVVANLTGFIYMLPLSISISTLVLVGQNLGAGHRAQAKRVVQTGVGLVLGLGSAIGLMLWWARGPLVQWSTQDPAVQQVALGLIGFLCLYQLLDALQTLCAYALRGHQVTFLPMVFHTVCMWGIGLGGGYWLSFKAPWLVQPSVVGFWQACVLATLAASVLFVTLLVHKSKVRLT